MRMRKSLMIGSALLGSAGLIIFFSEHEQTRPRAIINTPEAPAAFREQNSLEDIVSPVQGERVASPDESKDSAAGRSENIAAEHSPTYSRQSIIGGPLDSFSAGLPQTDPFRNPPPEQKNLYKIVTMYNTQYGRGSVDSDDPEFGDVAFDIPPVMGDWMKQRIVYEIDENFKANLGTVYLDTDYLLTETTHPIAQFELALFLNYELDHLITLYSPEFHKGALDNTKIASVKERTERMLVGFDLSRLDNSRAFEYLRRIQDLSHQRGWRPLFDRVKAMAIEYETSQVSPNDERIKEIQDMPFDRDVKKP